MEFSLTAILHTLKWRWNHLGKIASLALPFYLFPAYTVRWQWQGYALGGLMILGYGTIKYLLLILPFLMEVTHDD